MNQDAEFGKPTFCKILPELPKPEKLRRQIRKDGGYDMVPAYSPEEMYKYGELCVSEAIAALQAMERNDWIDAEKSLPEWARRDDTPVELNGQWIKPTLTSQTVLVQLESGSVRTDQLVSIEDSGITWWNTFGKRVKFWMPTPEPFDAAKNEGEAK